MAFSRFLDMYAFFSKIRLTQHKSNTKNKHSKALPTPQKHAIKSFATKSYQAQFRKQQFRLYNALERLSTIGQHAQIPLNRSPSNDGKIPNFRASYYPDQVFTSSGGGMSDCLTDNPYLPHFCH